MGWSSGSRLLSEVIESIKTHVDDDETRHSLYVEIVDAFEQMDCDTIDECLGIDPVYDEYLKSNGWEHLFEDEEDDDI